MLQYSLINMFVHFEDSQAVQCYPLFSFTVMLSAVSYLTVHIASPLRIITLKDS